MKAYNSRIEPPTYRRPAVTVTAHTNSARAEGQGRALYPLLARLSNY
jgi:hypothetical protein